VTITYGDSAIGGIPGTTALRLNSTSGAPAQFQQAFIMAMSIIGGALGAANGSAPWDGLIGMGRSALAAGGMAPPVVAAAQQGAIPAAMFGLWLAHDPSGPGKGGEVALGGWNPARVSGDINWVPVARAPGAQQGYWSVALEGVKLGGRGGGPPKVVLCAPNATANATGGDAPRRRRRRGPGGEEGDIPPCVGTFDSGTALLTGPVRQVGSLVRQLGFAPGGGPPPEGCAAAVDRLLQLVVQAGEADPSSPTTMAEACTSLPDGPLSPVGLLCGAVTARLSAAISEAQGPPMPPMIAAVRAEAVEDCGALPYCYNATTDCARFEDLPTISFVIGGKDYSVAPQQYVALVRPLGGWGWEGLGRFEGVANSEQIGRGQGPDRGPPTPLPPTLSALTAARTPPPNPSPRQGPNKTCLSMLSCLGNLPQGVFILGDTLMHGLYTVYDYGNDTQGRPPRIGLAALGPAEAALLARLDKLDSEPLPASGAAAAAVRGGLGAALGAAAAALAAAAAAAWA
jgi:hypothetical protein